MSDPHVIEQPEARPVVACSDLLCRLRNHLAMLAPHQKERMTGKLLSEATNALAATDALLLDTLRQRNEFRERIIRYIKDHDQDDNSTVDELKYALDETEW